MRSSILSATYKLVQRRGVPHICKRGTAQQHIPRHLKLFRWNADSRLLPLATNGPWGPPASFYMQLHQEISQAGCSLQITGTHPHLSQKPTTAGLVRQIANTNMTNSNRKKADFAPPLRGGLPRAHYRTHCKQQPKYPRPNC